MEIKTTRRTFPRFKERLQTKYLKAPANKISSVRTCCRFVTVSLDDVGDCSSVLSGDKGGVTPVIFHDTPNHSSTNSGQKPRKCISKEHACFSKQMIQKQIGREYVAAVEKKLKQHPLAMFPHYEDHMTSDLFDKVVSVLDPDMSVNSASALPTPTGGHVEEEDEEKYTEPRQSESAILGLQDTSSPSFPTEVEDANKCLKVKNELPSQPQTDRTVSKVLQKEVHKNLDPQKVANPFLKASDYKRKSKNTYSKDPRNMSKELLLEPVT